MRKITSLKTMLVAFAVLVGSMSVYADNVIPKLYFTAKNTPSGNANWTITNAAYNNASTDYFKMLSGSVLESPAMNFSLFSNIQVALSLQSFSTIASHSDDIKVEIWDGSTWTQVGSNLHTTSTSGIQTVLLPYAYTAAKIKITAPNATASAGARVLSVDITGTSASTVSTPTFSPSSGNYTSTQNVSISTTTAGASIYYTTNGDAPTTSSTLYTGAVPVSSTTTIKAIAVLSGMSDSPVASATYTFPTNVADIAALRAATTPGFYKLTGEAILTFKSATRNSKYIQDASGAVLIDDNGGVITTAYNIGDGITGIAGTTAFYNGMLQFTPVVDPGVATSTNNTVPPVVITPDQLINNQGKLVKVQTVSIAGSGNFAASTSYVLNGNSGTVLRTQYADLNYIGTAIPAANQDLTGVVLVYNTTAQLVPRALTDFVGLPTSFVAESSVPEIAANVGSIGTSDIHVSGLNLTGDISLAVSGTDAGLFSLSVATVSQVDGAAASTPVTVSYTPVATGSHTAILTLTSPGAASVTRVLSGTSSGYTGLQSKSLAKISSSNGKLIFSSEANQTLEVYNAVGQKVLTLKTVEGLNTVPVKVSGVVFVKLGSEVSKVIM